MGRKILVAFDFDHTIIDGNSDIHVVKLAPDGKLPQHIKDMYSSKSWTNYMASIFAYLHDNGVNKTDIQDSMKEIPLVVGMRELLNFLSKDPFEVIIISDSNSVFIDMILKDTELDSAVAKVFTNPAHFKQDGCLTLDYYHTQDWCDLSTINLCKGHILENYLKEREQDGVVFSHVGYVGDGTNDLCPSLRLQEKDIVFPRKGFSLIKKLGKLNNDGNELHLQAAVEPWDSGLQIMEKLQTFLPSSGGSN